MALHGILGTPKTTSELRRAEVRSEVDRLRHAPLCTTLCHDRVLPPESPYAAWHAQAGGSFSVTGRSSQSDVCVQARRMYRLRRYRATASGAWPLQTV
jgi:hypothetical protein